MRKQKWATKLNNRKNRKKKQKTKIKQYINIQIYKITALNVAEGVKTSIRSVKNMWYTASLSYVESSICEPEDGLSVGRNMSFH
jgi:hypothetical protein